MNRRTVGDQHLECGDVRRFREGMGVLAEEQRTLYPLGLAVLGDGLRNGQHVLLVERTLARGTSVTGRSEGNTLAGLGWVGLDCEVFTDQTGYVGKHRFRSRLAGKLMHVHGFPPLPVTRRINKCTDLPSLTALSGVCQARGTAAVRPVAFWRSSDLWPLKTPRWSLSVPEEAVRAQARKTDQDAARCVSPEQDCDGHEKGAVDDLERPGCRQTPEELVHPQPDQGGEE